MRLARGWLRRDGVIASLSRLAQLAERPQNTCIAVGSAVPARVDHVVHDADRFLPSELPVPARHPQEGDRAARVDARSQGRGPAVPFVHDGDAAVETTLAALSTARTASERLRSEDPAEWRSGMAPG